MSVVIKSEGTGIGLVDMLVEDIENHVQRIVDLSIAESPDSESVEYHHGRITHRIMQLKGVVLHHGK